MYSNCVNREIPKFPNHNKPAQEMFKGCFNPMIGGALVHLPTHTTISDYSGVKYTFKEQMMCLTALVT